MGSLPRLDGSALCQQCGLCCDGTLLAHTDVRPDEADAVGRLGLAVEVIDDRHRFRQPCAMHRGSACAVYAARPAACRQFQCEVLKGYERGTLSFAQSEQFVERARALRQDVIDSLSPGEHVADLLRAIDRDWDSGHGPWGSPASRQANAEQLVTFAKLRRFLQRHFHPPR